MPDNYSGYELLAAAILRQAIADYRTALKKNDKGKAYALRKMNLAELADEIEDLKK